MICPFNSKTAGPQESHLARWRGLCLFQRRRAVRWVQWLVGTLDCLSKLLLYEQECSMCENESQMEELTVAKTLVCSLAHLFLHTGYTARLYFPVSFATRYG